MFVNPLSSYGAKGISKSFMKKSAKLPTVVFTLLAVILVVAALTLITVFSDRVEPLIGSRPVQTETYLPDGTFAGTPFDENMIPYHDKESMAFNIVLLTFATIVGLVVIFKGQRLFRRL